MMKSRLKAIWTLLAFLIISVFILAGCQTSSTLNLTDNNTGDPCGQAAKSGKPNSEEICTRSIEQANSSDALPALYLSRGIAYARKKEDGRAMLDFNKAIELSPNMAESYYYRGILWMNNKEFEKAMADYDRAIDLNPTYHLAYYNRGSMWQDRKDYARALAEYKKAFDLNPQYAKACNNIAWIKATCVDARFRNGQEALTLAQRAVELEAAPAHLDTLAAAYAENGDYPSAVQTMQSGIAKLKESKARQKIIDGCTFRLKQYQNNQPYREE